MRQPRRNGDGNIKTIKTHNTMIYQNEVTLVGKVGTIRNEGNDRYSFSVVHNRAYKNAEGKAVIKTNWFAVQTVAKNILGKPEDIRKGTAVKIRGWMDNQRFTDAQGNERTIVVIVAKSVCVVPEVAIEIEENES